VNDETEDRTASGRCRTHDQGHSSANAEEMQRAYFQKIVGASSADELAKLADLKKKGVLTDAEFNAQKAKLLS